LCRLNVPVRLCSASAFTHTLTPPTPAPIPDALVDDVPPYPISPCWPPGVVGERNLTGRGYWDCCSELTLCISTVLAPMLLPCTGCDGAGSPYCPPAPEWCQDTSREVKLVHTHQNGPALVFPQPQPRPRHPTQMHSSMTCRYILVDHPVLWVDGIQRANIGTAAPY
jgi:hypothetical protein